MDRDEGFFIPKNIYRSFTIAGLRASGIVEGLILGFLGYKLVSFIPMPYAAVKIVFELVASVGLFFIAARGFVNYTITEYLIIIAKYFLNRRDREYRRTFRFPKAKEKGTDKGYAQGLVIEEEFGDGVIKLKDGRYVAIVLVSPVNFFTKTEQEREIIVMNMAAKLRSMPVKGQFVSYTTASNPYEYIDFVRSYESQQKNRELKEEYEDYYKLCRAGIGYGTVKQKFMVVFSSDALDQYYRTDEERLNALRQCSQDFMKFMEVLSNNDNAEKITTKAQFKRTMTKALFEVYNPVVTALHARACDDRQAKVENTFKIYDNNVDKNEIPTSYFLAPMGFDDTASSRYVVAGDCYYSFYYIMQNTYPTKGITPGWIAQQYQQQGIEYHLFYQQITDANYISKLNHATNITRNVVGAQRRESILKSEVQSVLSASTYLKDCMEHDDQPYYMGVMISIHSNQITRLYMMEDTLIRRMREQNITIVPCRFLEKEAYLSTRLGNQVHPKLWKKMRQNVPASVVAAMFPFASTSVSDRGGVYLGNSNGTPVFLNLFDTSKHDSANIALLGSNGKGKTFTVMLLALRNRLIGREIFIIAPIKGYEFDGLVKCTHGNMIRINSTSGNTINIMEIFPHLKAEEQDTSLLYKKVESVKAFIMFKKPDMTAVEQQILDKCTIETFKRFGITQDNDSLWEDKEKRIKKKMPILGDLVKTVDDYAAQDPAASDLATVMHVFTEGSLSFFNAQTNIDLSKGMTVFDLSGLSASTKTIAMFATTELIQSYMEEDRSVLKMLIVDEIWMLLENEGSAEVVIEWSKTIRGRGGSLCVATQELADLSRTKKGSTLISQSETRILLGMRSDDLEYTGKLLSLTEPMIRRILDAKRGNGVLLTRDASVGISMMGSGHNILSFTTDPNLVQIRSDIQTEEERRYVESLMEEGKPFFDIKRLLSKYREAKEQERQGALAYMERMEFEKNNPPPRKPREPEQEAAPDVFETAPPQREAPPRRKIHPEAPPRRKERQEEPAMPPRRIRKEPSKPPRRADKKEE